ncbi:MAG: hypothetical protein M0P71_14245 [Melioribacteraceae bacterium]|nr:hypothetical protein [Melioribacteraceae bacterium]
MVGREFELVDREEAKEILLTNNPELKIIYKEDELEEEVDGVCEDIEKVRKFMNGVNEMIEEIEQSDPKFAKLLKDKFYNLDEDEIW